METAKKLFGSKKVRLAALAVLVGAGLLTANMMGLLEGLLDAVAEVLAGD